MTQTCQIEISMRAQWRSPEILPAQAALEQEKRVDEPEIRFVQAYMLEGNLSSSQIQRAAQELFADPILHDFRIDEPFDFFGTRGQTITIARLPGVMDPAEGSILRALSDLSIDATRVRRARKYHFLDFPPDLDLSEFAAHHLANPLIEELTEGNRLANAFPPSRTYTFRRIDIPLEGLSLSKLESLSQQMGLALDGQEMSTIQQHFQSLGRAPTDAELETLAQTWSEHCKHKTLTGPIDFDGERIENLLRETVAKATRTLNCDWLVSVFVDNAGIIEFDSEHSLAIKVETHNHPSALEPYGGAGTGTGGVIRDILGCGLGARPILATDVFCVGPLETPQDEVPSGCHPPRRILREVVAGVRDYGNRMGIPTVSGAVHEHPSFLANPLVFCGTVGLMPTWAATKKIDPGDRIVVVGGRTGRDGIHGATFSSQRLDSESEVVSSGAVQIGDPITEKKVLDALLEARDLRLYSSLTDCGAGGLSSAIGEMGEQLGAEVHLDRVPLKYSGLSYDEIWISEAQERMVLAVPPDQMESIEAVFRRHEVEATDLGHFADHGKLQLFYEGQQVCDLEMSFLHDGLPQPLRIATHPQAPPSSETSTSYPENDNTLLLGILGTTGVSSKEWIIRQYDHEVQGRTVLGPLVGSALDGPSDATVVLPIDGSLRGAAIACGGNPHLGQLDPYQMAAHAVDEALRNVVSVGADPDRICILDNFSWADTRRPEELGSLVLAARACHDTALAYRTPFVSGKDSLNNEFLTESGVRIAIPPTLIITSLGIVPDASRTISMDWKSAEDRVYLIGSTKPGLGGSHLHLNCDITGGSVPILDPKEARQTFLAVHEAIQTGLLASCHDLSEGGLAVAAAESALAGRLGAQLDLSPLQQESGLDVTTLLWSESPSRFLVSCPPESALPLETLFSRLEIPHHLLGKVAREDSLQIQDSSGSPRIQLTLENVREAWQGRLEVLN